MRIHTDASIQEIQAAISASGAYEAEDTMWHASQTHTHAFDVHLAGSSRRRPGFGSYADHYAATWDEWGLFFAALYRADANARCGGSVKSPVYANAGDYHRQTANRFLHGRPDDMHGDHDFRFNGTLYEQKCTKCSAVKRWGPRAQTLVTL
jgi:hypothetical protein